MQVSKLLKISLDKAARAIRVCMIANIPVALWGRRGTGKSSVARRATPDDWGFYWYMLADKDGTDLGGIPFPHDAESGEKRVRYLMTDQLPFDCNEHCVVCFDEIDRTPDMSVQNAALQLVLDRRINGHELSPNARLIICGNGATDVGTIPLSKAAAGRMLHLYVSTDDEAALNAWLGWAKDTDCSPALQSFAKYNQRVWTDTTDAGELEEYGTPTPRTFVMADKIYRTCKDPKLVAFEVDDILLPLLAGCVGIAAATELLKWYKISENAPTIEEILRNPKAARLPTEMGVFFALGLTIARVAQNSNNGEVDAFTAYIARWGREQAQFAFTHLLKAQPRTATSAAYIAWSKS
jgi:hypothetical protein